jgi:hypothetical protein
MHDCNPVKYQTESVLTALADCEPTPAMVEAAARQMCAASGENADETIYYRETARGNLRVNGRPGEHTPSAPFWKWRYESQARSLVRAMMRAMKEH